MDIDKIIEDKTQEMYKNLNSDYSEYIQTTNPNIVISFKDKIILNKAYNDIEYIELTKLKTLKQLLNTLNDLINILAVSNFTTDQYNTLLSKVNDLKKDIKYYDKPKI